MDFKFFAPAYLVKSGTGREKENRTIKVGGRITTSDPDADGDIVLTDGLDFSRFTGGFGKIKYEHDTEILGEPDNIIGFPTAVHVGNGYADFEGDLIDFVDIPEDQLTKQQRMAKSAFGLFKAIDDYNRTHPENPQKIGWSIEGKFNKDEKSSNIIPRALITHVVLTTKPINANTYAELRKSLEVGHSTDSADKTGWGATRTESIEKDLKHKEYPNMTKNEYIQECIKKGMTEEEAKKAADEKFKDSEGSGAPGEKTEDEKDLNDVMNDLADVKKSLNTILSYNPKSKPDEFRADIKKSISDNTDKIEDANVLEYFKSQHEGVASSLENDILSNHKVNVLAKSMIGLASALEKSLKINQNIQKSVDTQNLATQALLKGANSSGIISSDLLKGIQYDKSNDDTGGNNQPISKADVVSAVNKLVNDGKLEKSVGNKILLRYESMPGFIDEQFQPLIKSTVQNLKK